MIRQPPKVGALRFHHEPESINSLHADVTATTFQGNTSVITSRRPYHFEGARWHLLTKVSSNPESFKADFYSELLLQERLDENPKYRSFTWQVLRKASEFFGAKPYIGETGLTTTPFFSNVRRGAKITRGAFDDSPVIVNWNGLDPAEQVEITPTLEAANNWIICTHPLGPEKTATPPIPNGTPRIFYTKGKAGRERGWWRGGTDKLASYGLDTEVWISLVTLLHPRPSITPSGEIRKGPPRYAIRWGGIDLLGGHGVRPNGHLQHPWGHLRHGRLERQHGNGSRLLLARYQSIWRRVLQGWGRRRRRLDSLTHDQPIMVFTDSKGFMTVASNWVG